MSKSSGLYLVSGGYDNAIYVSPLANAAVKKTQKYDVKMESQANRMIITPDKKVALGCYRQVVMFSFKTSGSTLKWQFDANITDIQFKGHLMYCCGEDKTVQIVNTDTRESAKTIKHVGTSGYNSICLDQSHAIVVAANEEGSLEMLKSTDLITLSEPVKICQGPIRSISLDHDLMKLVAARQDGHVSVLTVTETGIRPELSFKAHEKLILRTKISPDKTVFVTTSGDSTAKLWDIRNCECVRTLHCPEQTKWIWDADFSMDSTLIATGGTDTNCRIWI